MVTENRLGYIDIIKCVGIILMIMGHVGFGSYFDHYIHAFHMPIFFIVSGYLWKNNKKFRDFALRKVQTLLIPWILFLIIQTAWEVVLGASISKQINMIISGKTGIWFLTAMFIGEMLFYWIMQVKNNYIRTLIVITVSLLGNLTSVLLDFTLPLGISASFVCVGLMYIGFYLRKVNIQSFLPLDNKLSAIVVAILFLIVSILIFVNEPVNMRTNEYGFIPLFWLNAVLMFEILIALALKVEDRGLHIPQQIGMHSIVYLGFNQIIIDVVNLLWGKCFEGGAMPIRNIVSIDSIFAIGD